MSAVNYLEAALRVDRTRDDDLIRALADTMMAAGIAIVAATPTHAELAREAYRRFGKGNHGARLNLADCFAYALAKEWRTAALRRRRLQQNGYRGGTLSGPTISSVSRSRRRLGSLRPDRPPA
jgi:hypothetical protein